MDIHEYIDSGITGVYILGLATPQEAEEFERRLPGHPDLQAAYHRTIANLAAVAYEKRMPPPPGVWKNLDDYMRNTPMLESPPGNSGNGGQRTGTGEYIPLQAVPNTHIRVHKYWRWVFFAVFILSKIFLILFIYYILQYQHTQEQLKDLQQQVRELQLRK
ncbi:MAG TPA: hypothetical protein VLD19_16015 [Chitinophagaceae bacterium]|nr:hypothetical protein [Chitinophagaceae bacterium]